MQTTNQNYQIFLIYRVFYSFQVLRQGFHTVYMLSHICSFIHSCRIKFPPVKCFSRKCFLSKMPRKIVPDCGISHINLKTCRNRQVVAKARLSLVFNFLCSSAVALPFKISAHVRISHKSFAIGSIFI